MSKTIHTFTFGVDAAVIQGEIEAHFNVELSDFDLSYVHNSNPSDLTPDTPCDVFVVACKPVTEGDADFETVMGIFREFEGASTRQAGAMFIPWKPEDVDFFNLSVIGDKKKKFRLKRNMGHVCDKANKDCVVDFVRSEKPN